MATAAQLVARRLYEAGCRHAFGIPGGEVLTLMEALKEYGRNTLPPNVEFSIKEWSQGVEIFRREKATLIRGDSGEGLDRLTELFGHREIAFERLNKNTVAVRGAKNEKAILGLADELRQNGLYVE